MKLKMVLIFNLIFHSISCDSNESIDPIDTEFYQEIVYNKTVKQEIEKFQEGKIVNGSPAALGQFDYFVIVYGENRRYLCGGTLIKTNWVLTAGHCLHGYKNFEVHFGTINRLSPERILKIEDDSHLIVHEDFDSRELFNDIALIYLAKMSISWLESSSIGFVEPKLYDGDLTNKTADICGFGKTSDNSGASYTLNYIRIPILDTKECEIYYYLDENNICVSTKSGESPCNGDSGGGVVITTEDYQKILIGIISFGNNLCTIKYPVALTKVSNYLQWMEDKFDYFENQITTEAAMTTTKSDVNSTTTTTVATKSVTTTTPTPNSGNALFIKEQVALMIVTIMILINGIL